MASKEFGNCSPMEGASNNTASSSSMEGSGATLDGGGGRNMDHNDNEEHNFKLHFTNIPVTMTEIRLTNIIKMFAKPLCVYIFHQVSRHCLRPTTWGIVEFGTFRDAEVTLRGFNEKPPYHFHVKFVKNREERAPGGAGDLNVQERNCPTQPGQDDDLPFHTANRSNQQQLQLVSVAAQGGICLQVKLHHYYTQKCHCLTPTCGYVFLVATRCIATNLCRPTTAPLSILMRDHDSPNASISKVAKTMEPPSMNRRRAVPIFIIGYL